MPSDAAKKRAAKKKASAGQRGKSAGKNGDGAEAVNGSAANGSAANGDVAASQASQALVELALSDRSCTGVLASHNVSRDLHIDAFCLASHGVELFVDTRIELNCGRRYGLLGLNGCGKSSLLECLGNREVPIPSHMDIFMLRSEIEASDKTALEAVVEVDLERSRLEAEVQECVDAGEGDSDRLLDLYERLDEMDSATAEAKAAHLLYGLGFTPKMQATATRDFSGGWRMRIALARALFVKPHLLLLDEPTNHLDLEACVWLEEELKTYKRILVLVSHSQDFLNGVCTNILHVHNQQLRGYGGNYDSYVKTRAELEENQTKQYQWEQEQISHMKDYIARFGHGSAKLARQAQSKEKTLKKMVESGLTEKVSADKLFAFSFKDCGKLPPPVVMIQNVSFRYGDDKPLLYKDLEFGIDLDTRIALVGPNGAGKSTLLKLIDGELVPTDGIIRRHGHLRIRRFHQHLQDMLDLDMSAVDWMMKCFPEVKELEDMRRSIGQFSLTGKQQMCAMRKLSDGQRCRVVFAWLSWNSPHLLLLDEPTNHLDIETIDALADAINHFEGGMVLVSHDFRLIGQVAKEIWVCEHQTVTPWTKDIQAYKESLRGKVMRKFTKSY